MRTAPCLCAAILGVSALSLSAKPVPDNLGNGLDKIVINNLIQQGKITSVPSSAQTATAPTARSNKFAKAKQVGVTSPTDFASYKATIAKQAASFASRALTESATGKYLVEIMP